MGYDIAYHAIDAGELDKEILPYIFGEEKNIDPAIEKIVRVDRNRTICGKFSEFILKEETKKSKNSGWLSSLKSKFQKNKGNEFSSDLYIWGRPFLVLESVQEDIFKTINKYSKVKTDKELFQVLKHQADLYAPTLYESIKDVEGKITKDLLDRKEAFNIVKNNLKILKDAYQCYLKDKKYVDSDKNEFDPKDVLGDVYSLLQIIYLGFPAWMDRGVSPTLLIESCGLAMPEMVRKPHTLLGKYARKIKLNTSEILPGNYSLGMVLPPESIPAFLKFMNTHKKEFISALKSQKFSQEFAELSLQKIEEALIYCQKNKCVFVESSELFSGPGGIIT